MADWGNNWNGNGWNEACSNNNWSATGAGQQTGSGAYGAGQQMSRR